MTHTYAILDVSPEMYAEVRAKLEAAEYTHAFLDDGEDPPHEVLDLHGVALRAALPGPERWLCLRCSQWIDPSTVLLACPNCGSPGVPASSNDLVTVKITWHELRCLVIWAENFANQHRNEPEHEGGAMPHVVYGIADRLMTQHLGQSTGLTLASEIAEVRARFGPNNVTTNIPDGPPQ